jgi:hypothetical protein
MDGSASPERQAALDALAVSKAQIVFYQAGRISGRYVGQFSISQYFRLLIVTPKLTHAVATLFIYDFLLTLYDNQVL